MFGIIEGVTEWLPVSSTGHIILLNEFINLNSSQEFWHLFEVVIQLGAILAVVLIFWKQIFPFGKSESEAPLRERGILSYVKKDIFILWLKIAVATVPAVLLFPFADKFEELFYNYQTVSAALIIFGIAFIVIESAHKNKPAKTKTVAELTFKLALIIGLFQVIAAVFPGTSRSGATIIGALLVGVSRTAAAEFTFYLAIPAMFGASILKLFSFGLSFTFGEIVILLIASVTAFVVSVLVIRFLMSYIKKHDFKVFGWYRIALGILVLLIFSIK